MDAFAPASVTAVFAPDHVDAGSRGASVALEDGVTVSVESAAETTVAVDGEPADFEPVTRLLDRLGVAAGVDVQPQVPLGSGFGASGAATLATALAANERFELGLARDRLVEHSHEAEVAAGTGLGDVFVQDAGGLVYNVGNGRERVETEEPIEYATYGGLSTADALADEALMNRVREEGGAVLDSLSKSPTVRVVVERSWPFARALDLPTERVVETVGRVEDAGGAATMAMLGETVVAVGCEGVLPDRTRVSATGARLL